MATTRSGKKPTTTRKTATTTPAKSKSLAARTGRTMRDRPYASATIAAGAATVVAGIAGLLFMKKSGKSFGDVADDISAKGKEIGTGAKAAYDKYSTEAKSKYDTVSAKVKDGVSDVRTKVGETLERRRDGVEVDKPQTEFSKEALQLKEKGKNTETPIDPVVENQTKVGAISY
jgi:gas vesicle protein